MLEVSNLNYASEATVIFQRLSVIVTDLLLFYAIHTFARARAPWLPTDHKHSRTTLVSAAQRPAIIEPAPGCLSCSLPPFPLLS